MSISNVLDEEGFIKWNAYTRMTDGVRTVLIANPELTLTVLCPLFYERYVVHGVFKLASPTTGAVVKQGPYILQLREKDVKLEGLCTCKTPYCTIGQGCAHH